MSIATYAPVLDAARGVGWPALRRVRSAVPGPHVSLVRGTSDDFVEYRPYRQGDDPSTIDWKLVARTDRVYIQVSQERAVLPTVLVVDGSASMAFPQATSAKWELARQLAVGLAAIARHRGDPVGLAVTAGGATRIIEPRTRRTVLDEMMRVLEPEAGGDAPLTPALHEAMRLGARVVIISDFLGDADAMLDAARAYAAAGRELFAIHVIDPGELDPDPRKLLLTDPEHPEVRRPMAPAVRAEYLRRFGAWREQLARDWRRAGAVFTSAVPGAEPIRGTLRRITSPNAGKAAVR